MPNDTRCSDQSSGQSGDKTFRFKNYKIKKKNHHPYGAPYFRLKSHQINLKKNGDNIDVIVQLRVKSYGFKTSASDPEGKVPRILYTISFDNGDVVEVEVPNTLEVPFECNTQNEKRTIPSFIMAQDADKAMKVCWEFNNQYRIVRCGSK